MDKRRVQLAASLKTTSISLRGSLASRRAAPGNVIRSDLDSHREALAVEGTKILLSICSHVRKSSDMAMVAERHWRHDAAGRARHAEEEVVHRWLLRGRRGQTAPAPLGSRARRSRDSRRSALACSGATRRVACFGVIDERHRGKRQKKIHSSETLCLPSALEGERGYIRLPAVGATSFSSLPGLGF